MNINAKFETLTLVDNGIILGFKNEESREISFSEVNRVYLKVYRLKPIYEILIISILFVLTLLFITLTIDLGVFGAFVSFILFFTRINRYKVYRLNVCLNDGSFYNKKVPLKLKEEYRYLTCMVRRASSFHINNINASA